MSTPSPAIQISGSSYQGVGQPSANGVFSIGADYADLIANGANAFTASGSKVFDLAAGELSMASPAQIGVVVQGVTVTADMVHQNQLLLDAIGSYCIDNGISIVVEAQLSNARPQDWTYQWLGPAVTAGLPIVAVENDTELDNSSPSATQNFGSIAANEVAIVNQIVADYPDVQIGQWVGGGPTATAAEWWNAYNAAARIAGLPAISYVVADTSWNAPWVTSTATWQTTLQDLSATAHADGMKLDVLVDGIPTDASGSQWTAQSEQHAAMLAAMADIEVNALRIESWSPIYPDAALPVNQPTTIANDAAEIAATYSLYQAGCITTTGDIGVAAPPQLITQQDTASPIIGVSLGWSAANSSSQVAVVIMDATGQLSAQAFGNATVSGTGTDQLVLNGNPIEIAAELRTLSVYEALTGPDNIDIEIFGANGRVADTQIQVLSLSDLTEAIAGTIGLPPASPLQTWTSGSASMNNGQITSLNYTWAPSNYDPATSSYVVTQNVSIHEPLAEPGVTYINGIPNEPLANPSTGSAASLPFAARTFRASAYNPAASVVSLDVLTSTMAYGISGQLDSITMTLAPSDPVASITGASPVNYFAAGGSQVVEYNTNDNLGWQSTWGAQYHSVTTTYGAGGQMIEQVFQGGVADPYYILDNVYNPYTGQLWEQIQTGSPPQAFASFITGPEYVTQFNTGNNPNWDASDWGNAAQVTVTFQDYYATAVSTTPPSIPTPSGSDVSIPPLTSPVAVLNDFGGNGYSDILFAGPQGDIALWTMQNGVATSSSSLGALTSGWSVVATGDFYGTGTSNILFENTNGDVAQWKMQNAQAVASTVVGATTGDWNIVGTGDFYGNGTDDVLFRNANGTIAQWQISDGHAVAATTVGATTSDWRIAAIGNLSGSGSTDGILFINSDGAVADWDVVDGQATSAHMLGQTSSYWSIVGVGDFTGSGEQDILFRGQGGEIATWLMHNGQVTGADEIGMTTADWQVVGIGDYTGNGTDDILFRNTTSSSLATWELNNGHVSQVVNVGATTSNWHVAPTPQGIALPS